MGLGTLQLTTNRLGPAVIGMILIYSGIQKSGDLTATRNAIQLGLGISLPSALTLGYMLIFIETALGLWLVSAIRRKMALSLAVAIFLAFAIWSVSFLVRGIRADCGCGFSSSNPNLERGQWIATIRASALLLMAASCLTANVWKNITQSTERNLNNENMRHIHRNMCCRSSYYIHCIIGSGDRARATASQLLRIPHMRRNHSAGLPWNALPRGQGVYSNSIRVRTKPVCRRGLFPYPSLITVPPSLILPSQFDCVSNSRAS